VCVGLAEDPHASVQLAVEDGTVQLDLEFAPCVGVECRCGTLQLGRRPVVLAQLRVVERGGRDEHEGGGAVDRVHLRVGLVAVEVDVDVVLVTRDEATKGVDCGDRAGRDGEAFQPFEVYGSLH